MKADRPLRALPGICLAGCVLLLAAGCEVESAGNASVSITPSAAEIVNGQTLRFQASGWNEYHWSLANPTWGVLSADAGDTTFYTSIIAGSSNQVQVLRLRVTESSTATTNTPAVGLSAEAYIRHK